MIQSQLNELEPLQRNKLQLALHDCMSEAMKESLALAVREIRSSRSTTANLFEAVLVGEAQEPSSEA